MMDVLGLSSAESTTFLVNLRDRVRHPAFGDRRAPSSTSTIRRPQCGRIHNSFLEPYLSDTRIFSQKDQAIPYVPYPLPYVCLGHSSIRGFKNHTSNVDSLHLFHLEAVGDGECRSILRHHSMSTYWSDNHYDVHAFENDIS